MERLECSMSIGGAPQGSYIVLREREKERERERERERDDRGRVLRLPLVAPPSLFQPRDGVGFDRYDFDDVNDDDDRNNTCFLCTPMCLSSFISVMRIELDSRRRRRRKMSLSLSRVFFRER